MILVNSDGKKLITNLIEKKKKSKISRIFDYYFTSLYKNFESNNISSRIIEVDIEQRFIENGRGQYKLYVKPIRGLPEIYITNPASFLYFCNLHGFLPKINEIRFIAGNNRLNFGEYKDFVLILRLFHLLFKVGYDFTSYDVAKRLLHNENIKKIFEDDKVVLPVESEILSLIKLVNDIKKSAFDIPKNYFHDQLGKMNNEGALSENIFLEVSMKYENFVRDFIGFDTTYIKPASFDNDSKNKTDFEWSFALDSKKAALQIVPIQYTLTSMSHSTKKIQDVENYIKKSNLEKFIYVQINGGFPKNFFEVIKDKYKNWLSNPDYRQKKDPSKFPFFINEIADDIKEPVLIYLAMHKLFKRDLNFIGKVSLPNGISLDLSKVTVEYRKLKLGKKYRKDEYDIFYDGQFIGKIIFYFRKK